MQSALRPRVLIHGAISASVLAFLLLEGACVTSPTRLDRSARLQVEQTQPLPAAYGALAADNMGAQPTPALGPSPRPTSSADALPPPIRPLPWSTPPTTLLADARDRVARQLDEIPATTPYGQRLDAAADRVLFLPPFEYLVRVAYENQPKLRDELVELYRRDPAAGVRRIDQLELWPAGRGDLLLTEKARFDLDADRVLVNRGATSQEEAVTVLVHELWHALPTVRYRTTIDGDRVRVDGFWSQRWDERDQVWVAVEDRHGLVFPPYQLSEAFASRQEGLATGRTPGTDREIQFATAFLARVEAVIGRERLLLFYLTSDDQALYAAARANRERLAEFFAAEASSGPR